MSEWYPSNHLFLDSSLTHSFTPHPSIQVCPWLIIYPFIYPRFCYPLICSSVYQPSIFPSIHPSTHPQTCLFLVLATCLAWFSASCWEPNICFLKLETPCQYKSLSSQEISGPQECCRFRQDRWLVHCPPSVNLWRFSPSTSSKCAKLHSSRNTLDFKHYHKWLLS